MNMIFEACLPLNKGNKRERFRNSCFVHTHTKKKLPTLRRGGYEPHFLYIYLFASLCTPVKDPNRFLPLLSTVPGSHFGKVYLPNPGDRLSF
jgi:hypothetical protein